MQASSLSAWQQLKRQQLTCDRALELLVSPQGVVRLELLDLELETRFWRTLGDRLDLPPVIPLLLWQNCYYLGTPVAVPPTLEHELSRCLGTDVRLLAIAEKSYRQWHRLRHLDTSRISIVTLPNPLTGELEYEDITETAEFHLSQADSQIERIKALISSALRNRASDIHLAPTPDANLSSRRTEDT